MARTLSLRATRLLMLALFAGLALGLNPLPAQTAKVKSPESKHAMDLAARTAKQAKFSEATKYGVEVYLDPNVDQFICITDKGVVGLQPKAGWNEAKGKTPEWKHGMNLRVRKAGEANFDKDKTAKFGVEVYLDPNTGNLVYITDTGHVASIPAAGWVDAKDGAADWKRGMELPVRKAAEKELTKDTKRFNVEVYSDPYTKNLIFIAETGSIAVVPGTVSDKVENPVSKTAMSLSVRKGDEDFFNDKTQRYGIEVYQDANTKKVLLISETGQIAIPQDGAAFVEKTADWLHGLNLQARKAGENTFGSMTAKYGLEVFKDPVSGTLLYISEKGSLGVPVK